ncbi:MAG: flagellar M-ring protein FliF [Spirochaetales bacterium]|nr:flagellar M-ring protein FliF [Spirochaetales bacterium]
MNEWLKKVIGQVTNLWSSRSTVQKLILVSIVVAALLAIILLISLSSRPSMVPLITSPITDENARERISLRLDEEGIDHSITSDGKILVPDQRTARKMVSLLAREDLIPKETSPWDVFKMDRWTVTDFERKVNLRQAIEQNLEQYIETLEEVDSAEVTLVLPETEIFLESQRPVTASIILTPTPGSDIVTNRKKLEGIVRLVKLAVEGLEDENIAITDHRGILLNDFTGLADLDDLELAKRQMRQKTLIEQEHKALILSELRSIFSDNRVRIINMNIDLNFDKETNNTREFFPVTMTADNPTTPYDETQTAPNVLRSKEQADESFEGTGFNPEGPPGQEGQTPPAYKDLDNLIGKYENNSVIENYEVNERNTVQQKSPWQVERITISVAIDGIWKWEYDDKGDVAFNTDGSISRIYQEVDDTLLKKARALVEDAIGFDKTRGDSVTVVHIQFDRTAQHIEENERFRNQARLRQTILYSLVGLAAVVAAFIFFRLISRELERRRRLREEELSRQHQAMREAALRSAEEDGLEVEMSVEERARLEMQENAINMAREHPEDVAQLIRTWLVEE